MEIISYVVDGELEHQDSMGNGSIIRSGDVQKMSAGKGVLHSEYNPSNENRVHFLQIWIKPNVSEIKPEYEQKYFNDEEKRNNLKLIVSPNGERGSLKIHQDAKIYSAILEEGRSLTHVIPSGRCSWVQVVRGWVELSGTTLKEGDGAAISDENEIKFLATRPAEILLFDLAQS